MKKIFALIFFLLFTTQSVFAKDLNKKTPFTIFSGDKKASYFAVASGICNVFNLIHAKDNYECLAVVSKGSESNLHSLANQEADFAIIKTADFNKFFVKNFSELENKIDFVAKIHDEYLTILVQKNLKIDSLNDLNDKSVNIGHIGSSSALIVEKYFSNFAIKPKKIVNLGAEKSFEMLCNKKIDAWVYFIGHPNPNFQRSLTNCNLKLISLPRQEIKNFLATAPFFKKGIITKNLYNSLPKNIETISTKTILAAHKGIDPKIIKLVQDILENHKEELVEENEIFREF